MSVFGHAPFNPKTEYRVEYTPKTSQWLAEATPWESQINLSTTAFSVNSPNRSQHIEAFRKKIYCTTPAAEKLLSYELDPFVINLSENAPQTSYTVHYCKGRVAREERKNYSLPDGWVTPETTQKCSFRSPKTWFVQEIKNEPLPQRKSHFQPNEKERAILGVTTGETNYSEIIGKTGAWIKETKYLGDASVRPKFDETDLIKAKALKSDNL